MKTTTIIALLMTFLVLLGCGDLEDESDSFTLVSETPFSYNKKNYEYTVNIDSDGGDLYGTMTIIDAIALSKTPVWTINIGCAYSGGFFTFICGHRRIAYPHASFLYHEGSVQNGGTAIQFRNFSEFHERKMEELKEITLSHTKISEELYDKKKKDDWWITANEAVELGIADEITERFV
jgi:ATP-dependent Clp protease protease subunit